MFELSFCLAAMKSEGGKEIEIENENERREILIFLVVNVAGVA